MKIVLIPFISGLVYYMSETSKQYEIKRLNPFYFRAGLLQKADANNNTAGAS